MGPWQQDYLDVILVPCGLLLMFGYHLILVHRYLKCPQHTAIGYENHHKRAWVKNLFQVEAKERGQAISVMGSSISAATSLSSISLALCSIIAVWIGSLSSTSTTMSGRYIYGNRGPSMAYVKYVSLLVCFLVAFACFVQATRYLVHANYLISMPASGKNDDVPASCVVKEVLRGSHFWQVGLRSLYLSTNLVMWIFGPIPMFVCSVIMVGVLVFFDRNTIPLRRYD